MRAMAPSRFPALTKNPNATYVLTDGVLDHHYNLEVDWSRHLPPKPLA